MSHLNNNLAKLFRIWVKQSVEQSVEKSEGFAMMQQMLQPGMPNQYYGQGQRSNYGHFSNQYIYIQQLAQSQKTDECSNKNSAANSLTDLLNQH